MEPRWRYSASQIRSTPKELTEGARGVIAAKPRLVGLLTLASVASAGVAGAGETRYTYDVLGRLTAATIDTGPLHGQQQSFAYDAAGNRTAALGLAPESPQTSVVPAPPFVSLVGGNGSLVIAVGDSSAGGSVFVSIDGVPVAVQFVVSGSVSIGLTGAAFGDHAVAVTYTGDPSHLGGSYSFNVKFGNLDWLPSVLDLALQN
jgi:hypothetical protein